MLIVVIVSWNVRELLGACLRSLQRNPATSHAQEIIVVDNASSDGSAEFVRAEFPSVHLITNVQNRGFSGGNNDGVDFAEKRFEQFGAESAYVLLLNPDTEVTPGALDALLAYADSHSDVGMAGPQLLHSDGTIQSSRRRFPTLVTALFESTWLQPLAPHRVLDSYFMRDTPNDDTCDVDWLYGAAMLVRRATYRQCGVLDEETFFMYSEEVDWCRRIKSAFVMGVAGEPANYPLQHWRIVYVAQARIIHHEGRSSVQVSARRMIYFNTSKVRYFRKHHGTIQANALRLALLSMFAGQTWLEGAKWILGHKKAMRAERVRAYVAVLCSGLQ